MEAISHLRAGKHGPRSFSAARPLKDKEAQLPVNWMDRLEQKIGKHPIHHLMIYLIVAYAFGFLIDLTNPGFYDNFLSLNAQAILHGQVWRLVTFLIAPPSDSIIWLLLLSVIYYQLGELLEQLWGAFRFNLYIFIGVLGCILAAFIIYGVWGQVYLIRADSLYLSMLLALSITIPDMTFYLYFVLPIKAKWLSIFYGILLVVEFVTANGPGRVALVMSILNFLIFFLSSRNPADRFRQAQRRRNFERGQQPGWQRRWQRAQTREPYGNAASGGAQGNVTRINPRGAAGSGKKPIHRCVVCGRTELDDPNLEFRYCSKCDGGLEYCSDHLYTHVHVKNSSAAGGDTSHTEDQKKN